MLKTASLFCSDDADFGALFAGRFQNVLWDDLLPAKGAAYFIEGTAAAPVAATPSAMPPLPDGAECPDVSPTFAAFLADVKAQLRHELSSVKIDPTASASTADGATAAAAECAVGFGEAFEVLFSGPVTFVFNELPKAFAGSNAKWAEWSGRHGLLARAWRFAERVVAMGFAMADSIYRRTSIIDLFLDGVAAVNHDFIRPGTTPREMLFFAFHEMVNLAQAHMINAAIATIAFRIGSRHLAGALANARGEGIPKVELLSMHLLLGAMHHASAPALDAYFFRRLWAVRILTWLRGKWRRAPLVLVPGFIKRALGLTRPPSASQSASLYDAVNDEDGNPYQAAAFVAACLDESVWRTVIQRNLVALIKASLDEQFVWFDSYRRAFNARGNGYVFATIFKYQLLSTTTLAMHIAGSMAVRVAAAQAGHWVWPAMGTGAFWLEAAAHWALRKRIKRAVLSCADGLAAAWDARVPWGAPFGSIDPEVLLDQLEAEYRASAKKTKPGAPTGQQQQAAGNNDAEEEEAKRSRNIDDDEFDRHERDDIVSAENYYTILGVDKSATADEIRKAYRRRALQVHPDKVQHLPPAEQARATAEFKQLSKAHGVLADARKRAEYDNYSAARDAFRGSAGDEADADELGQQAAAVFNAMPGWMRRSAVGNWATRILRAPVWVQGAGIGVLTYVTGVLALGAVEGHLLAQLRRTTSVGVIIG